MMLKTSLVLVSLALMLDLVSARCWQKNTERDAHRDIYRCTNQLFEPGKKVADPENCQCYYDCNYRQQPCYTCCPDGQVFHPSLGCVLRDAYRCVDKPASFRCPSQGLFRHQEHCRKYWDCRGLYPVEEGCPEDHHWDDLRKVCRKDSEITRSVCGQR